MAVVRYQAPNRLPDSKRKHVCQKRWVENVGQQTLGGKHFSPVQLKIQSLQIRCVSSEALQAVSGMTFESQHLWLFLKKTKEKSQHKRSLKSALHAWHIVVSVRKNTLKRLPDNVKLLHSLNMCPKSVWHTPQERLVIAFSGHRPESRIKTCARKTEEGLKHGITEICTMK